MKARSRRSTAQLNAHGVVGDDEGGGISFVHRRVAYTEHVKEQIPVRILTEVNPLHIDVPQLLSFFRECCFSPTTLKPYKEKIKSLMKNFWDTQKEFLKKITRKDQKTELQNKKLDAMTKLDVILRMFIPTLLVKYVSYSAIEVFYTFLASLISMGAINWGTLHCLVNIKYNSSDSEHSTMNTYMSRWCDVYSAKRTQQWKIFIGMLHRPSHIDTFGALSNYVPAYRLTDCNSVYPITTAGFRKQRSIMGIVLNQSGPLLRQQTREDDGPLVDSNFVCEILSDYIKVLQRSVQLLKWWIHYNGTDTESTVFLFEVGDFENALDAEIDAEQYLAAYSTAGSYDGVESIPMPRRDGQVIAFPSVDVFKSTIKNVFDGFSRYSLRLYRPTIF